MLRFAALTSAAACLARRLTSFCFSLQAVSSASISRASSSSASARQRANWASLSRVAWSASAVDVSFSGDAAAGGGGGATGRRSRELRMGSF